MTTPTKPWAVLAYTVADDKGGGSALDASARRELKAICDAANFGRMSVAAQVDFQRPKGVFRGSMTAPPPKSRGFSDVRAQDHPLWQQILGAVDLKATRLRVQHEPVDLSAARASVLEEFLRFGRAECPADRYVVSFYGHAYGPMGLFCDRATGQRQKDTLRLGDLAGSMTAATGRASVTVFRDCFMSTLETVCQLQHATEFMVASQSLVPAEGVWPWPAFMAALTDDATPYEAGRALVQQLAFFLDDPANRGGFATTPFTLLDLNAAGAVTADLTALTRALLAARRDPARSRACAAALEGARIGTPEDAESPGDPALLDVLTMCDRLAALEGDPVARPAARLGASVGTDLVRWHHAQQPGHRGTALFYKPVRRRDLKQSYLQAEDATVAAEDAAHYRTLALSAATGWDQLALDPLPLAD